MIVVSFDRIFNPSIRGSNLLGRIAVDQAYNRIAGSPAFFNSIWSARKHSSFLS